MTTQKIQLKKPLYWCKGGFTLIELLVVISIISLLSSIVLSGLQTARAKARNAYTLATVREYERALEEYANRYGQYPFEGEETERLCLSPTVENGACTSSANKPGASGAADAAALQANLQNIMGSLPPINTNEIIGESGAFFRSCYVPGVAAYSECNNQKEGFYMQWELELGNQSCGKGKIPPFFSNNSYTQCFMHKK